MDISSSENLSPNNGSILVFSISRLYLCCCQSLSQSLFLTFLSWSLIISLWFIFSSHSFTHQVTHSHSFLLLTRTPAHLPTVYLLHLPLSQLVSPDSPLVFHLPSILAHSRCHWSVLASLSFSYQTELIWLPYQGWVQTGAGQRLPLPS